MDYRFALIGENIGYSLSPRIFEAIFGQVGVDGRFELCSIGTDRLQETLRTLVEKGTGGVAVTIPHKTNIQTFLDDVSREAKGVGAVNSVAVAGGRTVGHNTDSYGFSFGLHRYGVNRIDGPVLILGSGGAARAAIQALSSDFGVVDFTVSARNPERVNDLKRHFSVRGVNIMNQEVAHSTTDRGRWSLVVNCTPLGGANAPDSSPVPAGFGWDSVDLYYDLNYNKNNKAIVEARANGARTLDGCAMLVAQALESFRLWTGREIDFEPVFEAVFSDE